MGRSEIDRPFFIYTWSFSLSSLRLHTSPFHNLGWPVVITGRSFVV